MESTKKDITIEDLLLVLIGIIGLSFTTYQTTKGYELDFGSFFHAFIFSVLIGLSLAYLVFRLRVAVLLQDGIKIFWILLIYLCVASLSFLANFNYFFSETMKQEIIYNDIEDLQNSFSRIQSKSAQALKKMQNIDELTEKCNGLKSTLVIQITDKANPGWGNRAQIIVDSIQVLLGVRLRACKNLRFYRCED